MRIKIAVYIAIGLISAVIFLAGLQLPSVWSRVVSAIPVVVVGLFAVFDKWVWKWWIIPKLVQRPILHGTWRGQLNSNWIPSTTEKSEGPYEAFLVVTQTFTTLQISLITEQSKSRSVIADIVKNGSDDFSVFYHYGNTPKVEVRDGSPIHMGGVSFEVFDVRPSRLEGEYWTSRNSGGSMIFDYVSNQRIGSFSDGKKLMKEWER
ncbi:MAG: hypothetical protein U1B81_08905 [Arthrobacter sp.]|nr:hypothetical protein [Arthrobacter sp.]